MIVKDIYHQIRRDGMNSRGDITISTTVKLFLGILIVVILLFLVYKYILKAPLGEHECKAMLVEWCMTCDLLGYSGGPPMNDELKECAPRHGYMIPRSCCGPDGGVCPDGTSASGVEQLCNNFLPEIS